MARPKPRTRYQRESAVLEVIGGIKSRLKQHADRRILIDPFLTELCAAAEILLGAPAETVSLKWDEIDTLIDKANGAQHLTPTEQKTKDSFEKAGLKYGK